MLKIVFGHNSSTDRLTVQGSKMADKGHATPLKLPILKIKNGGWPPF